MSIFTRITVTCVHCGYIIRNVDANDRATVDGFACPHCGRLVWVQLKPPKRVSKNGVLTCAILYFIVMATLFALLVKGF